MSSQPADARLPFPLRGLSADGAGRASGTWRLTRLRLAMAGVLLLLFLLYSWIPPGGHWHAYDLRAQHNDQYNLLADGMLDGHLYLKENVPEGLLALVDPYDPGKNRPFRDAGLWDQSLFRGHCYLYFGVTPVITLYIPWRLVTGGLRIPNPLAVLIYTYGSLLFAAGLLYRIKRRYFDDAADWLLVAGVALVGTGNVACYLMSQTQLYQVAIASGMFFSLGSLYLLSRALHATQRRAPWLVAAGLFLALAAGSRPHFAASTTLVFLVTVVALWRRGDRRWTSYAALAAPFATGGVLLGLYNYLRFGSFFEFGSRYQLTLIDMRTMSMFGTQRIWSTLYFMFVQLPTINGTYPYVHPMPQLPSWMQRPEGFLLERITGLLVWTPFLWMIGIALLLAFRQRKAVPRPFPRVEVAWLTVSIVLLVSVLSMTPATMRYLADFASLLDISAVIAWLYLDQRLATAPRLRTATRVAGLVLLLVTVVVGPMLALPPPSNYMDG